ncbi:MAG: aconitate hydratase [Haloplanus sp.]
MADALTLTEKLVDDHRVEGDLARGTPVGVRIDQVLNQDVLGPLAWMEFEALDFETVRPDVVVTYADHSVLELSERDTQTHRYLRTVTQKYGGYYSKAGNGICHQVHRERFLEPGCTLVGCDSHTTTAGGFGALGVGAGGLDVAVAMGGDPYVFEMPEVVAVRLEGELGPWTSAKDVILELLRRLTVKGGVGKVFEFVGPGVETLSVPERCTITNMSTELGATTSMFPSDERTRRHLARLGREDAYRPLSADEWAEYDDELVVDLSDLEPLVARPSMPDKVVPVAEVAGTPVDQVVVGSCTNGSYFDVATVADVLAGESVAGHLDAVVAPASKRAVELLAREGRVADLYAAGATLSESTCGACVGQGHVPTADSVSLRTFNRNFEGRSGNEDDSVYLCSPEVAAVAAITGELTDPRGTDLASPSVAHPEDMTRRDVDVLGPDPAVDVDRGDVIGEVPLGDPLPSTLSGPVLIAVGDDVTTDHILPATADIMSKWPDPQVAAQYTLQRIDPDFASRAAAAEGGWVVGGENYGQGSSRENAALELAVLGVDGVFANSFARIHRANLANFGLLAFTFADPAVYDDLHEGDEIRVVDDVAAGVAAGRETFTCEVNGSWTFEARLDATDRQRDVLSAGGLLNAVRERNA